MRKKNSEKRSFTLLLVGDVMLGRLVNEVLKVEPPAYPWGDTLPLFQQANVRLCNLECVISDGGTPWSATPKIFHFRSDAKNVAVLQAAHIDAVSLANNHILDFDVEGLLEMRHHLEHAGIHAAGAGRAHGRGSHAASQTPPGAAADKTPPASPARRGRTSADRPHGADSRSGSNRVPWHAFTGPTRGAAYTPSPAVGRAP